MKLTKRINTKLEKFSDSGKSGNGYYEIYQNPSRKDCLSLGSNSLRFLADNIRKTLYVWDANALIHADYLKKHTKEGIRAVLDGSFLFGSCNVIKGELQCVSLSNLSTDVASFYLDEWDWVRKYIHNIGSFLE